MFCFEDLLIHITLFLALPSYVSPSPGYITAVKSKGFFFNIYY